MPHLLDDHPDWPNAMTTPTPKFCYHGNAADCCDACDREAIIERLKRDLAAAQERVEDLEVRCANAEARVEECERIITAMTQWLDQQQPDVFRRGLWDAIAEGKK